MALPTALSIGADKTNCTTRMNPLSFGEVALSLNVTTKTKKAVSGRRETAVYTCPGC